MTVDCAYFIIVLLSGQVILVKEIFNLNKFFLPG